MKISKRENICLTLESLWTGVFLLPWKSEGIYHDYDFFFFFLSNLPLKYTRWNLLILIIAVLPQEPGVAGICILVGTPKEAS